MLKELLNFLLHYRIFNPFMRLILSHSTNYCDVNKLKRETKIVVSISADDDDFDNLEYSLFSIFNQKVAPDSVVLWISDEYELSDLPYSVTQFIKNGLDVRFVKDKGSFTKILYALQEFNDCIVVAADENICYPKNWLAKLYLSYISSPNDIHAHSVAVVTETSGKITPVKNWKKFAAIEQASYDYFPFEAGGVLYPPNCFIREISREDIYSRKLNTSWEIWSWAISLVSGRRIRLVKSHINNFPTTNIIKSFKKYNKYANNTKKTDKQLKQLFEYYGNNISGKLAKK